MSAITLYHLPYSHVSAKVKVVALEKNIDVDLKNIHDLGDTPYSQINPNAKVPFLTTPDLQIGESEVIVEWFEESYPEPAMLPASADDKARSRLISRIHDLYIAPDLSTLFGQLGAEQRDSQLIEVTTDNIVKRLTEVQSMLSHKPFFNGEQFGLVDACYAMSLWYSYWLFNQLKMSQKLASLSGIQDWLSAIEQRDSVQAVFNECKVALGLDSKSNAA